MQRIRYMHNDVYIISAKKISPIGNKIVSCNFLIKCLYTCAFCTLAVYARSWKMVTNKA